MRVQFKTGSLAETVVQVAVSYIFWYVSALEAPSLYITSVESQKQGSTLENVGRELSRDWPPSSNNILCFVCVYLYLI